MKSGNEKPDDGSKNQDKQTPGRLIFNNSSSIQNKNDKPFNPFPPMPMMPSMPSPNQNANIRSDNLQQNVSTPFPTQNKSNKSDNIFKQIANDSMGMSKLNNSSAFLTSTSPGVAGGLTDTSQMMTNPKPLFTPTQILKNIPATTTATQNQNKSEIAQLIGRIKKIQQSNVKLEKDSVVMTIQLENFKNKSQQDKRTIYQMNKQITDLKEQLIIVNKLAKNCKCNSTNAHDNSLAASNAIQQQSKLISELKQVIKQLKQTNNKKEVQNQKSNVMLQKQYHMIENQTNKIQNLEKTFTNCLLYCKISQNTSQQQRINSQAYHENSNSLFNQRQQRPILPSSNSSSMFGRRQQRPILPSSQCYDNSSSMFRRRQQNPLSQSAVFNTSNNSFTSQFERWRGQQGLSQYYQDGYRIRYKQQNYVTGPVAGEVEIDNNYGKIIIFENMSKNFLRRKPISQVVKIVQNSCEVIDPEWQKLRMRLITYNFLNNLSMSPIDREQLKLKIDGQANKNGLIFERLDDKSGDLYLSTRPAFVQRNYND